MPDDEDSRHDEEELVLPEEDELDELEWEQPPVDLPDQSGISPLVRRFIEGREKPRGPGAARSRNKARESGGGIEPEEDGASQPAAQDAGGSGDLLPEIGLGDDPEDAGEGTGPTGMELPWREADLQVVELVPGSENPIGNRPGVDGRIVRTGWGILSIPREIFERAVRRKEQLVGEESWVRKVGSSVWWWLSAGFVCLTLIVVVAVLNLRRQVGPVVEERPERLVFDDTIESIPIVDFVKDPEGLSQDLDDVIRAFEKQETDPALLRGGAASVERLKSWRQRFPRPEPVHAGEARSLNAMAIREFGFVVLRGYRRDFSTFAMYFVNENGNLRMDWEASEGYSEVLPNEVPGLSDREPRMMRALLIPSTFYTDLYPEERYQCYTLQHYDPADFVWGFVERNSIENYRMWGKGLGRAQWGSRRRAVLRVRRGVEGSRPNQVEVVEFVQEDWIIPPVDAAP